ncbi:MAG: sodium:calcium antiporter, partial [Nitrospirota bacterium]|nr:sodium:calcium antiporter [Nitrospirota bacterium]MDE3226155.1 sodium:calcium antiporter [Nitrospirota bacterium]
MVTILLYVLLFVVAVAVTLGGCALFTNGIEWLGKRLKVPEGAVGSIFAAVGTTLPETSIPVVAIFFGTGQERTEVGLGAILGAPFMLSTLVLPILAGLLVLYARLGKRAPQFKLDYGEVRTDLLFFLVAYGVAVGCTVVSSRPVHYVAAGLLVTLYILYMKIKFSGDGEGGEGGEGLPPLLFARRSAVPSYIAIAAQGAVGMAGLVGGAHLFVTAAKELAATLGVSPLLLALLIAPLATELPEMSNSFLWLYRKKDNLAVGNVTGAMVFQGTFPVSVGLIGTDWSLDSSALTTMGLAIVAVGLSLAQLLWGGRWRPWLLGSGALLYLGFMVSLYGR